MNMNNLVERLRAGGARTTLAVIVIGLLVIGGAWTLSAQSDGEVVARVNGEAITKDDLYDIMFQYVGAQALDELILVRLVEQEAAAQGVTVTQEDVDAEVEAIAAQLGGMEQLQFILAQQGASVERLAQDIERNLMIRQLLAPEVTVTDEEVRTFFDANAHLFAQQEQVRARHILVDTLEEAEELRKRLLDGADFAELARAHSKDTGSGAAGGELGWFGRGVMVAPFEEAAFALPVGEISEPVQSNFGYHLIKVEERVEAEDAEFNDEIASRIYDALLDEKVQAQLGPWLQMLRIGADVEVLIGN